jgi:ketosteroid isomerase-like protein
MSQENVDIVRRLFEVFNRREPHRAAEIWAPDAELWPAYFGGGLLEGAVFRGHSALAEFIEVQSETWDSVVAEPVAIHDVGDRALVEVHLSAVGRASGIPVDRVTWNVLRFRGGKVASLRVYTGKDEALKALGLED